MQQQIVIKSTPLRCRISNNSNNMFVVFGLALVMICGAVQGEFHCRPGLEWWNGGTCVACTSCEEVVLRTCQPHKDTVCGSFKDIQINVIQSLPDDDATRAGVQEGSGRVQGGDLHWQWSWDWLEILLVVAALTSLAFVVAALCMIRAHKKQWRKMQQMDQEMEQDISRLIGKLAEVPNIQKTTAVLVDEHQIKKQTAANNGSPPFRWIYLDQLLGKSQRKAKCGNVYTDRSNNQNSSSSR